jgi:hypothetical protein
LHGGVGFHLICSLLNHRTPFQETTLSIAKIFCRVQQRFDQSCTVFFSSVSRGNPKSSKQRQSLHYARQRCVAAGGQGARCAGERAASRRPERATCRRARSKPAACASSGVEVRAARRAGARSKPEACACAAIACTAACALDQLVANASVTRPCRCAPWADSHRVCYNLSAQARQGRAGARPGPASSASMAACGCAPVRGEQRCSRRRPGELRCRGAWRQPPDELLQAKSRWRLAPI